ncbi:hypothetical protein [Dyadobacter sp. CY312]|uniref:hypothetical protein n=1 Tax=Dyadobacter sp. CY312 TaxID=2907303 RepID=UPI001F369451|nr:hypothetical protein [Dyadobacter sp. CY312]MCE7039258.1 hypothetical protein [Dyadobacter sp. CY312]
MSADLINAISNAMCALNKAKRALKNALESGGLNGKQVELHEGETHIQWRYVGDPEWIDLIAIADLKGAPGAPGAPGDPGDDGKSAFDLAVEDGFAGTLVEWLQSLAGQDGEDGESAYELAVADGYAGTLSEWILSLVGADGKSAYQLAVAAGFIGTELEWFRTFRAPVTGGGTYVYSDISPEYSPAQGQIRVDNPDLNLATFMYVNKVAINGIDIAPWWLFAGEGTSDVKSILYLYNEYDPLIFTAFKIKEATSYGSTTIRLSIELLDYSTPEISNPALWTNNRMVASISKVGDKGEITNYVTIDTDQYNLTGSKVWYNNQVFSNHLTQYNDQGTGSFTSTNSTGDEVNFITTNLQAGSSSIYMSYIAGSAFDSISSQIVVSASGNEISTLDTTGNQHSVKTNNSSIEIYRVYSDGKSQSLNFNNLNRIIITDTQNLFGLQYAGNYAAAGIVNDRWIPDYGAVKKLLSDSLTNDIGFRKINAQTGTAYSLVLADQGLHVTLNNSAAITLTVPTNATVAYPVGAEIDLSQVGVGQVTVVGAAGVTIRSFAGNLKLAGQYSAATLKKIGTNEWLLVGNLSA